MMGLTQQQHQCLGFIAQYSGDRGVPPSYQEIADHLGLKSKSGVTRLMCGLEERGRIRRVPTKARAYEVIPPEEARTVLIGEDIWPALVRYAIAEHVNIETAVRQFIRDGLEAA